MQQPRATRTSYQFLPPPKPSKEAPNPLQLPFDDGGGEARAAVGLREELLAWLAWQPMWLSPWHLYLEVFRFASPGQERL